MMLKHFCGAVLLMACGASFCEGAGKAVFSGTVINAKTKQPVPGIPVHFYPEQKAGPLFREFLRSPDSTEKALARTDAKASFALKSWMPGSLRMFIKPSNLA